VRIRHIEIRNFRGIKSLRWKITADFNCLIGPGDTCKTTILTALDYALSPRNSLSFDDADFFDQDVTNDIVIQATLADWDPKQAEMMHLFQESTFARYVCGLGPDGPISEPDTNPAFSISLRVDRSLEPKWFAVKGRDDGDQVQRTSIWAADRALVGVSRLDFSNDAHFTWGRNTILTRLSEGTKKQLSGVVAQLSREMRKTDISGHPSIAQCITVAEQVRTEASRTGVRLSALEPKIDVQRQSIGAGVISLHEGQVPLRNKGSGSKRLVGAAMQMKLNNGKNISVVDEMEHGLEPHRIRGLLLKLKQARQQVFATTHSAVVLRELEVEDNELWVCRRENTGKVVVTNLNIVTDVQGRVRGNAEAFLGSRIVACEGSTEIGLIRAYDMFRFDKNDPPVWTLATSYFNSGGASKLRPDAEALKRLGYRVAVLCDNDAPTQITDRDIELLRMAEIHITNWDSGHATEHQLFAEIPWPDVPALLRKFQKSTMACN
jgi:putative ATP-dependent endonuclease of OLD family